MAGRCLQCKLCEEACPAHLKISDYILTISEGMPEASLKKIFEDNPVPAICGRICMKHCEDACSLRIRGDALAIRWLKRFAADSIDDYQKALELKPGTDTGKKIAVIGAGPSGLSLAYFLRLKGHNVVVFDDLDGGGGTLRAGPPAYRLPLGSIDKDVDYIEALGVKFVFNTRVGKDIAFDKILKEYDAVFMGIGNTVSFSTRVENSDHCCLALDFLKDNKIGNPRKVGKEVIVIGGGNVAMEEAREEGIQFNPAWGPKEVVLDEKGNVIGLNCRKVKSVFDQLGRFAPAFYEDQTQFLKGDMIIEAIGQRPDFALLGKLVDRLKYTERRKVAVDKNGMTSIPRVFAGGDIVNINLDAVTAIADAKVAAEGIDRYLKKGR